MKKIAGSLRLDLAAFRELEAFAQLGTDLDAATQARLDRGYRMVELLKQPQYEPRSDADQVMVIYAGTKGFLDKVAVKDVARWEKEFIQYVTDRAADVRALLTEKAELTDEVIEKVEATLNGFNAQFKGTEE